MYMYVYMYICIYIHFYSHIYRETDREREIMLCTQVCHVFGSPLCRQVFIGTLSRPTWELRIMGPL